MVTIIDTEADKKRVYESLREGRRNEVLNYSILHPTYKDFRGLLDGAWAVEHIFDGAPRGVSWLSDRHGKVAQQHFAVYKGCEKYLSRGLQQAIAWAFTTCGREVLLGYTPKTYRAALRIAEQLGRFKRIFEIPDMCYIARFDRYVPCVVTMCKKDAWREDLNRVYGGIKCPVVTPMV